MRYDRRALLPALCRGMLRAVLVLLVIGGSAALFHPRSPLPDEWHPLTPLDPRAPLSWLTDWKLARALGGASACLSALDGAEFSALPALRESADCGIEPRVALRQVGAMAMRAVETRCQTALRLAMWEAHGLQAAARRHFGAEVAALDHFSSYSCRRLRRPGGESRRMSSHARADAIDVAGFRMSDGTRITLATDWQGAGDAARFLRDAFESACRWFPLALGPDYNSLHADHFHLQGRGRGLCR